MKKNYKLELYYFPGCPYCDLVTSKISSLGLKSIVLKNIRQNPDFQSKLMQDTGRKTVPCLYINDGPMHESKDIIQWLETHKSELA